MSIVDNLLIAIDDSDLSKEQLEKVFCDEAGSILFASLGRLVNKGCVKSVGKGQGKKYVITPKGTEIIEEYLGLLNDFLLDRNFKWVIVSVSISDKNKGDREKIRKMLISNGFGLIKNGMFLGKLNNQKLFVNRLKDISKYAKILIFNNPEVDNDIIVNYQKYWKIATIKKLYKEWKSKAQRYIDTQFDNKHYRKINGKIIVYEFARILNQDPKINTSKINLELDRKNLIKLYKKVRTITLN